MLNLQDLPDELILKIFGYSETKDLITYGQVSKRMRKISHDSTSWVTVNLVKKIVKTKLLEMILSKECKILNLSNSTIVGSLSSNMKHNISSLDLSQSTNPGSLPGHMPQYGILSLENIGVLEELLSSSCSLLHLKMESLIITPKMAAGICKNGKTLQGLNLNNSCVINQYNALDYTVSNGNLQAIIKSCHELKELTFIYHYHDLEFLSKKISPNVIKLNLSYTNIDDDNVKMLLSRCNKIKVLNLEATLITEDSLKTMRQYLNLTLEELSLTYNVNILELKSMARLKILNLHWHPGQRFNMDWHCEKVDDSQIKNQRQHLPHLTIRTFFDY